MSFSTFFDHLFNFVAPAFFLAVVLAVVGRFYMKKPAGARALIGQVAINFIVGVIVLAAGLMLFGRDGEMATYAALIVVCGSAQWVLGRGWRQS